jgi:exonuclease VII small subunit
MTEPKAITFEKGYLRLQEIAEEVNRAEVPVDRMGDLFAEGKGLEKALTGHLEEQKARMERIERGEEVQAFRITSENGDRPAESNEDSPGAGGGFGDGSDETAGGSSDMLDEGESGSADDRLPF